LWRYKDIFCLRYARHIEKSAGNNPLATLLKRRPYSGGIAYLKKYNAYNKII
jgi:hypothetical protein